MQGKISSKGIKMLVFAVIGIIIIAALFFWGKAKEEVADEQTFAMSSNSERVKFLNRQGFIVTPDPVLTDEIVIPSEINPVYAEYAALLKKQGFDIKPYMGQTVTRISYAVLNYPDFPDGVTANMLIFDGRLIGGDVTRSGDDGFTLPLVSKRNQAVAENTACDVCGVPNCPCGKDCSCTPENCKCVMK